MAFENISNIYPQPRSSEVYSGSDNHYKKIHRFERYNVAWMSNYFLGLETDERRPGTIGNVRKMEVFLRYLSDPGYELGVWKDLDLSDVSEPTLPKVVAEVTKEVLGKRSCWINFPRTVAELQQQADVWSSKFKFPHCIGVIDWSRFKIQKLSHALHFTGRNDNPCINGVLGVACNADNLITHVDVSYPLNCPVTGNPLYLHYLCHVLNFGMIGDHVLLSDSGYPISKWVMKPYAKKEAAESEGKANFNKCLKAEQMLIKNVLGEVKQRFNLEHPLKIEQQKVLAYVTCCCILHNVSKYLDDNLTVELDADPSRSVTLSVTQSVTLSVTLSVTPTVAPTVAQSVCDTRIKNMRLGGERRRDEITEAIQSWQL